MSHYTEQIMEISDRNALMTALADMGFTKDKVKTCAEPTRLEGYEGDQRQQRAHVILPRKYVGGASNDVGFERMPDGRYRLHVSEYDLHCYGKAWQDQLMQRYGYHVTLTDVDLILDGYRVVEENKVGDAIQIVLSDD